MTCPKCGLQIDGTSGRCPFCHTKIGSREDSGRLPERAASPLLLIFAALLAAFSGLTIVIFAGFTFGYVLAGPQDSYVEAEDWYMEDEPSPFGPFLPVPMESQLIFSESGLSITADRLAVEDVWEPELSLTLSNDTDETVVFTAKAGSVNGFMNQMRIWQEIPPGQSAEGILVLDGYGLDLCGNSTVRNLEVNFEILRGESQLPLLETGLLTVVTEAGDLPAPETFPSRLLFQESGIRVSLLPIPPDSSVWQEDGPLIPGRKPHGSAGDPAGRPRHGRRGQHPRLPLPGDPPGLPGGGAALPHPHLSDGGCGPQRRLRRLRQLHGPAAPDHGHAALKRPEAGGRPHRLRSAYRFKSR